MPAYETALDPQPKRGDPVIPSSPGAPEGEIYEVFCRGRLTILTRDGSIVSIPCRRLVWSHKRRAWRSYTAEIVEQADQLLHPPPRPSEAPKVGDWVRLDGWPLCRGGVVTRILERPLSTRRVTSIEAIVVSTRRGPLTLLPSLVVFDHVQNEWYSPLAGCIDNMSRDARQSVGRLP